MIHHVSFRIPQGRFEDTVAFYELLGFTRISPPESLVERTVWLEHDATQIHLQWLEVAEELSSAHSVGVEGHVALVVSEYLPTLAALEKLGVSFEQRASHWGSPRCYLRDPAGNKLELMEYPPPNSTPDDDIAQDP